MLDISVADGESGPVLVLTGECDFTTMSSVAFAVDRCLRDGPARVTIDLRAVTFCDCSAARVLRHAQCRATAAGTRFRLTGLPAPVRRVLTLMQATTLLEAADEPAGHDDRDTRARPGPQPAGQRYHQDVPSRSPRHGG